MNTPPEQVTLTPTECNDCGGSLAPLFADSRIIRCVRCGHTLTPGTTDGTYRRAIAAIYG